MIENKSIQVDPKHEQMTIDTWQSFGWNLISTQEIRTESSHLEQSGDSINSVTQTTNYVKLAFNRDTNMPNYKEIVKYEAEYQSVEESWPGYPDEKTREGKRILWVGVGSSICIGYLFTLLNQEIGSAIIVIGIIASIVAKKLYNKKIYKIRWAERDELVSSLDAKMEQAMYNARKLL